MEPFLFTAKEASRRISSGRLTAEALVRSCLERIEARDAKVRAWAFVDPNLVIKGARRLDRSDGPAGPLHGVPVGVKDVIDTADMPTEYNSCIYKGRQPRKDAVCVARLRAAGAIIMGKTETSEFAGLSPARTRNPHDLRFTPGGSSSGSAASVGDFMVPIALGTQTGGSTIRPASYCGAFALKPSYGLVSIEGIKSIAPSYDTVGVIARSMDDLATTYSVLIGEAVRPLRVDRTTKLRIGYCETPFWRKADLSMRHAMKVVASALEDAGNTVEALELPPEVVTLSDGFYIVVAAEASWSLARENADHKNLISGVMRRLLDTGRKMKAREIQLIRAAQTVCSLAVDRLFDQFDALLTPAGPGEPERGRELGNNEFNRMWTAMHMPCLTIPTTRGANGLPIGIQLVGRRGADRDLLKLGKRVEEIMRGGRR